MLKKFKPCTPGQRGHVVRKDIEGEQSLPLNLRKGKRKKGGRNNTGKITIRHRGGGAKNRIRDVIGINKRGKEWEGEVKGIQYDPNRTGRLVLRRGKNGKYEYMIAGEKVKLGQVVKYKREYNEDEKLIEGSIYKLGIIPVGKEVSNLEIKPGKGAKYIRTAGGKGIRIRKTKGKGRVRLPSGKILNFSLECIGILGKIKGEDHRLENKGKAGRNRNLGIRPSVRGEAINPVDHPHGGRTRGGRPEKTPWGRLAKGVKTAKKNKKNIFFVV